MTPRGAEARFFLDPAAQYAFPPRGKGLTAVPAGSLHCIRCSIHASMHEREARVGKR